MKMLLVVSVMLLGMCGVADALTITNGGFETGDFNGWIPAYSPPSYPNAIITSDNGFGPTQGSYFTILRLETSISQYISWNAGDTLSFDWNFNTYDWLPWNDWAVFQINDYAGIENGDSSRGILADVATLRPYNDGDRYNVPGCGDPYANGCYDWDQPIATGWNTYLYTFSQSGSGFITFGVFSDKDFSTPSYLYIDNVGAPVPEPSTFLLLGAGLAGLGFVVRRRRKE